MTAHEQSAWERGLRALLALLLVAAAVGVGRFLLTTPRSAGLAGQVRDRLPESGVENPVTAVLLDFRGYDTLLEIAVLTLTLVGVQSLGVALRAPRPASSPVLVGLGRAILPIVVLVAGYLVWVGTSGAGGAFQAGAVLAAGGVLHVLAGHGWPLVLARGAGRFLALVGLAVFLGVGVGLMAAGRPFLDYPPGGGYTLVLAIELAATLSIATILFGLFLGGRVEPQEDHAGGTNGPGRDAEERTS
ncbi:MAG: sodium:proton antiporter [Deltaproteobacteria bacterium]|jgi:multisubunit Na+/H+ antiporter MnhB subunit|nr:sodium:proton antiporter [Deltaproteobacteria bacterium]MBW2496780.1 sodium:proton antiporter [Deltaproteobacteria bacterium]